MHKLLDTIARRFLPIRLRENLATFLLRRAYTHSITLKAYLYLIHGYTLGRLDLRWNSKDVILNYSGYEIRSPREGIGTFFEIFEDKVYDGYRIREGDIVVDVGAYVGTFTIKASLEVGDKGLVIAVEPEPRNLIYLGENCRNLPNTRIVEKALWSSAGQRDFYTSYASPCHSLVYKQKRKVKVWTETLDNIERNLSRNIDYIKMDAEGSELEILKGAEEVLKHPVRLSIASYHVLSDGKPESPEITKFLEERGFKVDIDKTKRFIYAEKEV